MTAQPSNPALALGFRSLRDTDRGFILSAWSRSYERAPAVRLADPAHYRCEMAITIGRILKTAKVLVAHDPEDENTIAGFAVYTDGELHYVYVRGGEPETSMRKMGIARTLLSQLPIKSYTFRTEAFERRIRPRERGWIFTPRHTL